MRHLNLLQLPGGLMKISGRKFVDRPVHKIPTKKSVKSKVHLSRSLNVLIFYFLLMIGRSQTLPETLPLVE